jgi:hypothetical protein
MIQKKIFFISDSVFTFSIFTVTGNTMRVKHLFSGD